MDNDMMKQITRENLKKKFKGNRYIPCSYIMKYPHSIEREYIRLTDSYVGILKEAMIEYLPEIKKVINKGTDMNMDSKKDNESKRQEQRIRELEEVVKELNVVFARIGKAIEVKLGVFDLYRKLETISNLTRKLTIKEWKKAVGKTLGINILDDYYMGDLYQELLEKWISDNVNLIKTIPKETLSDMKQIVYQDYINGKPVTDIVKNIQKHYGTNKKHAILIARDQIGKLNCDITKKQQKDVGVSKYKWSTSKDERVRDSHSRLEGKDKIYSWNDPPETDKGRRCHPGQDYQCRCIALPVFDIEDIDIVATT